MSGNKSTIRHNRSQEAAHVEADLLTNIRLAAEFAQLAEGHAALFDDNGMRYCVDRFLDHARAVSNHLKKLRGMDQKNEHSS